MVFWIACFLVALELGLEVRARHRGWETLIFGFPVTSESVPAGQQDHQEFGPTPSFPFRSRIAPQEKVSPNHRYWIASSSHAEDIYLSPSMTFPNVLERLLKEKGSNAVVLNASRAGLDIPQNVNDLRQFGKQWQPDYVILYQMSLSISSIAKRTLSGSRVQGAAQPNNQPKAAGPITWANWLVEHTTIYANVKGQISARIGASRVLVNDLGLKGEQEYVAMLRTFIDTVRSMGSVPVLTTFATSHTRKDLAAFPRDVALGMFKYSSFLSVEGWVVSVERLNATVRRVASEEGVMLIDLESSVAGRHEFFKDFVHFSPAGHEAVAQAIGTALIERENKDPKPSIAQHGPIQ